MGDECRIETDSMGEVRVPRKALYAAQTQRAVDNFPVSGKPMPPAFIRALGWVKAACAMANADLGALPEDIAHAVAAAAREVAGGDHVEQFPVDVFQTGSGTSSNMNANEVIATLASRSSGLKIHPNDHVNKGQSSNDVVPTSIQVAATLEVETQLLPAITHLEQVIRVRAEELSAVIKTGRTHFMDAMPISLGQELDTWADQLSAVVISMGHCLDRMRELPIGGTAVGTGINAHPAFDHQVCTFLTQMTGVKFSPMARKFSGLSSQDASVALSGQLKVLALALMKIANDLRLMNSGPLAGLGEIRLPALQPGSSIMPGKVNPVIPEAVCMVAAQVIGNDATITIAGQSGSFQLNVMFPVVALNLLESIQLLANVSRLLADKAMAGFEINHEGIQGPLDRNPILVTALNNVIGYELGARIAKQAYKENRAVIDVAEEMTDLTREQLKALLDPAKLAYPHD